ncbi:MAG: hypothetical protein RIF32_22450 [Leptospirales bacterium]
MTTVDLQSMVKVPVAVSEDLVKIIRLLAMTGKKLFLKHLYEPLDYGGWKRRASNETARKLMERMDRALADPTAVHTIGPLGKRLISSAMNESLSALGDSCIFFLERMPMHSKISTSREAIDFVQILHEPLTEFNQLHRNRSERIFEEGLQNISADDLKQAFQPVDLDRYKIKVEMQRQAVSLFHKIVIANRNDDLPRCRKLIAAYLIAYGDQENNNREEVEKLIDAFQERDETFRFSVMENIAINLYYDIQKSITQGDLRRTIMGIRKYAHVFEGNPEIRYFNEIDGLEQKLYKIISAKNMWGELKK